MRLKRNLKLRAQRCFFHLKSMRFLFFVPLAVVNILLPVMNYLKYRAYGLTEPLLLEIKEMTLLLLPFLSIWWVLFAMREYVESDGGEVLFACADKNKLPDAGFLFLLYIADISLLYAGYISAFPDMKLEYVRMLCVCLWYFGVTYFLLFLTKSLPMVLMAVLLYTLINQLIPSLKPIFPLYLNAADLTWKLIRTLYFPEALAGAALVAGGVALNYRAVVHSRS